MAKIQSRYKIFNQSKYSKSQHDTYKIQLIDSQDTSNIYNLDTTKIQPKYRCKYSQISVIYYSMIQTIYTQFTYNIMKLN